MILPQPDPSPSPNGFARQGIEPGLRPAEASFSTWIHLGPESPLHNEKSAFGTQVTTDGPQALKQLSARGQFAKRVVRDEDEGKLASQVEAGHVPPKESDATAHDGRKPFDVFGGDAEHGLGEIDSHDLVARFGKAEQKSGAAASQPQHRATGSGGPAEMPIDLPRIERIDCRVIPSKQVVPQQLCWRRRHGDLSVIRSVCRRRTLTTTGRRPRC